MATVSTLRVEIDTDSGSGVLGTDDRVFFDIGTQQWQLNNVGEDDFQPGQTDVFDLETPSFLDDSDIRKIRLTKSGFDGWQPRRIRVRVNGNLFYSGNVDMFLDQGTGAQQASGVLWEAPDFPARFGGNAVAVSSIAIQIATSDTAGAGTNNRVMFSIGTREWQLNTLNHNDFEPGQTDTFVIRDIENLRMDHIRQIGLRKNGTGGWRPESILVWVNDEDMVGAPLYDGIITHWLDGGAGAQLEHGLSWAARDYPQPVPTTTDPQAMVTSLRVRVMTGGGRYAQTDDQVYFDIGSREWLLDNPQNDFERNSANDFELQVHSGLQRSDFHKIGLRKTGTNGWQADRIQVFLNGSTTAFYDGNIGLFLDAGSDAYNRFGAAWTARDFIREIPIVCWEIVGQNDSTIRPRRGRRATAALVDNFNTASYRTGAGSVNAIWSQGQLKFRVIDFRTATVADTLAQVMPDANTAQRTAMSNIAAANFQTDVVNVYLVRTTATNSNWFIPRAGNPPSVWVQDNRGGQTVNTFANFERVAVSFAHELGHFFGLPHSCDNAFTPTDPCTVAEQVNLMMGDGTDQTSRQLSVAEIQTAYANAATLAE